MPCNHKTKAHIVQCPSLNEFHSPAEQVTIVVCVGSIIQEQKNLSNPWVKLCDLVDIALDDRDSVIWTNCLIKQGDILLAIPMVHKTKYII